MQSRYYEENFKQICESAFPTGLKAARYVSARYVDSRTIADRAKEELQVRFDRCVDAYDMTKWKVCRIYDNISYRRREYDRVDLEVVARNAPVEPASVSEDFMDSPMDCESMALVEETSENLLGMAYAGYLLTEG